MENIIIELNDLFDYFTVFLRGFTIQNIRYFLFSGVAFVVLITWGKRKYGHLKIWQKPWRRVQIKHELKWSILSSVVLSFVYLAIAALKYNGYTQIYLSIEHKGWPYLFFSFVLIIFWHDTWFYWIHRFMHLKPVLKRVHHVHHKSLDPSPLAAFSFHPLETILEAGFVLIAVFVVPLHPLALFIVNFFQLSMNVIGHSGHEFFPKWFYKYSLFRWLNSSTHHHMHHRHFNCNYGLYFNFWDRLLNTNHPRYFNTFKAIKERSKK
ncbi:MAG: sterol desaturase family protein [Bacteroidia bacterium]